MTILLRRARVRGLAPWLALTVAAACGSSSIRIEDLDRAVQDAKCERLVRCGLFASDAACDAYFRGPPPSSYGPAVMAGKLAFDGERARQCEDALAQQSCDLTSRAVRAVPEACLEMFRGKVADGDACSFDQECASSRCDLPVCAEGVCCVGRCGASRPRGGVGDACDRTSECIDGFCGTDHACHALGGADAACNDDTHCDYGLACIQPSPSLPGNCKKLPRLGEACPYQRCADVNAICDKTSHCLALGLPGAPCAEHRDCSPFAECDMARHACIELPKLGMPCDVACAGDARCVIPTNATVGTCVAPLPNGQPCDDPPDCASQNCKPGPVFDSCEDYPICF